MNHAPDDTRFRLSKSKLATYEHCDKRLWLQIHARHLGQHDQATLDRFQFGHDVGQLATMRYPDGIMVEAEPDIAAAVARTTELVAEPQRRPIFEGTFMHEDVLIRADILEPDVDGQWRLIEVKASLKVKPYQLRDVATQMWVAQNCGIKISRVIIRHLAPPFSWARPDISGVRLQDTDVTSRLPRYVRTRAETAAAARKVVRSTDVQRDMGQHCDTPFSCEFQVHCRRVNRIPLLARAELGGATG